MFSFQPNLASGFFSPAVRSGCFLGAQGHCWASRTICFQLQASPNLVRAIIFLGNHAFVVWGVHEVALHVTKPCRTCTKNNRWPQASAFRGSPLGCCLLLAGVGLFSVYTQVACPERAYPGMSQYPDRRVTQPNHLQRISNMWTIRLSNCIINWGRWFGIKTSVKSLFFTFPPGKQNFRFFYIYFTKIKRLLFSRQKIQLLLWAQQHGCF